MHYYNLFIFVSNVLGAYGYIISLMNPSHGSTRFCSLRNCNNCPRGKKRKQLVIQIRKKNVYAHIIMFQSFIRHARVMNNFFVTSTDHLSLPLHFPRSLDGFGVLTSLWLVVNYSTVTNALLFYLHNFHQADTHNRIHYTLHE